MGSKLFIDCSGWNYLDTSQTGGWLNSFYPNKKTKTFAYYSQSFDTVEMIQTFYKKHYRKMEKDLFKWLTETTPENFKMSIKVPSIITYDKRLNIYNNVINDLTLFIDKISPLKNANKLGAIVIQLPPSFTIKEFRKLEEFLYMIKNNSVYFSNSYGRKAIVNALQFKEMVNNAPL